jgi:hypothetical protein
MKDKYLTIKYCCKWPDMMLVQEVGDEAFVYCTKCNHQQHFEGDD